MLTQTLLVSVLATLTTLSPNAIVEARLGNPLAVNKHVARHAATPDLEVLRRAGTEAMQKREGLQHANALKKRRVKKRKDACKVNNPNPQANVTGVVATGSYSYTPVVTATASASSSSSVPDNQWIATSAATTAHTKSASATTAAPTASPSSTSSWQLVEKWSGSNFFDNFNFWSWGDPTHGTVNYVDAGTAWNEGLISINGQGHAIMKVDTTQHVQGGRKSVRIHGNLVYTGGLVLMDAVHMPEGCGTWPAWWSNGPNWPAGGEIDILEGVNAFTQNQVSLHTNPGCTMPQSMNMQGQLTTGNYNSYDCSSANTANQGCGVRDQTNDNSYGSSFNSVGGGVYAMKWADDGINVWWFPRASIPSDISSGSPNPSSWGTPIANFPSQSCNPYEFFYEHFNIFDTTFCGDWAGADAVWNYAGYAGQSQSCAAITGYSSCSDYVLNSGSSFNKAYWEISYVSYYNSTSEVNP